MQVDHNQQSSVNSSNGNGDQGHTNAGDMDIDFDFDMGAEYGEQDVLEEITNLESTFYNQGYTSGHEHGQLHGLFEGRELGREKSWELWEEMGYYEGWSVFWIDILSQQQQQNQRQNQSTEAGNYRKGKEERTLSHAKQLLDLISIFPRTNPSSSVDDPANANTNTNTNEPASTPDLAGLISQIRAKYRLLCAALAVRPRLVGATIQTSTSTSNQESEENQGMGIVSGIQGPMKGVDTRQLRF